MLPLLLFAVTFAVLLTGYPVALTLAGVSLIFAALGILTGTFDVNDLGFVSGRLFGIITNQTLIAVPLFVFMGVLLEKTKIAEDLLSNLSALLGRYRGGLAITVILVGMLMAASTGIVGATVVTMGLMSLPIMLERNYPASVATGTICATGTLGPDYPALYCAGAARRCAVQRLPASPVEYGHICTQIYFCWRPVCWGNHPRHLFSAVVLGLHYFPSSRISRLYA